MEMKVELKKSFDGFNLDVSLTLREDLLVLFGPSGAGKSQILKMISGIVKPDAGVVTVGGQTLFDSAAGVDLPIRERRIGHLFQDYALFPHMTVYGNIAYGITHLDRASVREKVAELIAVMRLAGFEGRFPHELSGGQKQRCALARTLAAGPRLLLLDEPFSALDYQVREKLRADLLNIHRLYPITTVLVTHDLEEAYMLGHRIAVLNNGRIEQTGGRDDVFYRPVTRNVARFMGARNIFSGRVSSLDASVVTLASPGIGEIKANIHPGSRPLAPGMEVSFCIRPEEIIVIRPDRVLDGRVQDNIIEGVIESATGKGSTQILFLRVGDGAGEAAGQPGTLLKIELPNFVVRKLALAAGKRIRVSLKKENVWIIP
ncbi:MAG: ABC transporter ATP-binding protein [Thermodesulfobacteriota bacterium]|nr:MAG: ABC transporter ATP-binding protein [Thermodesulfobacteriota bacterium]